MDVTCERCSTEYEFDDALVSDRGTTVKCTNCGHQFKVRKAGGGGVERWIVRTVDGRELEFTALRELQSAIATARVTKDDVLSRDGARPRRLGSIAELEPFFAGTVQPRGLSPSTTPGLGNPPRARIATPPMLGAPQAPTEGSVAIPLPSSPTAATDPRSLRHTTLEGGFTRPDPPSPGGGDADRAEPMLRGGDVVSPIAVPTPSPGVVVQAAVPAVPGVVVSPNDAPPLPGTRQQSQGDGGSAQDTTLPANVMPPSAGPIYAGAAADIRSRDAQIPDEAPTLRRAVSSEVTEPPMAAGRRRSLPDSSPSTPTPTDVRTSYRQSVDEGPYTEPRFSSQTPSKQGGRARWIAGVVVLGALAFVTLTVGRKYLVASPGPSSSAKPAAQDDRVANLLAQGSRAFEDGDLEAAKEAIDKASALAEGDPKVAVQLARLATIRADVAWLRVRLLADDDPVLPSAKRDLDAAAERAKNAVDRAAELAPTDAAVPRLKVDALRLAGDRDGARKLVAGLGGSAQPDNGLVLAAIELGEEKPDYRTVVERLRAAATAEQNLGRARALLVYALVRSGAVADARSELDRLAALPKPHPLLVPLRAFVEKAGGDDKGKSGDQKDGSKDEPRSDGKDKAAPMGDKPKGRAKVPFDDGRVPDDYVWPGYEQPTAQPTAAPAPAPAPEPKPEAPAPAPAPQPTSGIPPEP